MAGPEAKSGSSARSSPPKSLRIFCPPLHPCRGCQRFDCRRARPSDTATRSRHSGRRRLLCCQYGTREVPAPKPTGTHVFTRRPATLRVRVDGYWWYPVPTRYPLHVYRTGSQALVLLSFTCLSVVKPKRAHTSDCNTALSSLCRVSHCCAKMELTEELGELIRALEELSSENATLRGNFEALRQVAEAERGARFLDAEQLRAALRQARDACAALLAENERLEEEAAALRGLLESEKRTSSGARADAAAARADAAAAASRADAASSTAAEARSRVASLEDALADAQRAKTSADARAEALAASLSAEKAACAAAAEGERAARREVAAAAARAQANEARDAARSEELGAARGEAALLRGQAEGLARGAERGAGPSHANPSHFPLFFPRQSHPPRRLVLFAQQTAKRWPRCPARRRSGGRTRRLRPRSAPRLRTPLPRRAASPRRCAPSSRPPRGRRRARARRRRRRRASRLR